MRPETNETGLTLIDPEVLKTSETLRRLGGDREFIAVLYQTFLDELDDRLNKFDECVAARDLPQMLKRAHSLKGAAATIDAGRVREAALEMEMAARQEDLQQTLDAYKILKPEIISLGQALTTWLKAQG